jgi:hypothetical protein
MAMQSNIFNNVAKITEKALTGVTNNTLMASRVKRAWDKDFQESNRIGNALSVRVPQIYVPRTGNVAQPNGLVDSFQQIALQQTGVDVYLTAAQLTLNATDFHANVVENMVLAANQQIDTLIYNQMFPNANNGSSLNLSGFNQFYGSVGTAFTNLLPFSAGYAYGMLQGSMPFDAKVSALINPLAGAQLTNGIATYLQPSKEIAEQYRNGSLGDAMGISFATSANVPNLVLGTWSGTILYSSGASDGGNTLTPSGQTGAFNPGECFTISGVYAVNPQGKAVTNTLKQFTVVSQVAGGNGLVTFSPPLFLSGPNQNINALPVASAPIYMWGTSAGTALSAGTGQVVQQNLVFHEDSTCFAMADISDLSGMGMVASSRMRDKKTGIRMRGAFFYDGISDTVLFRLDLLAGAGVLRQGFATRVIS